MTFQDLTTKDLAVVIEMLTRKDRTPRPVAQEREAYAIIDAIKIIIEDCTDETDLDELKTKLKRDAMLADAGPYGYIK